ncbi:MAG: hypothetical protein IJO99_03045 [Ruminococcus sp.]|nr:hypothetical protein [Ruminococcus sp.]
MRLEAWIYMGIFSICGAVFWFMCYQSSAKARIRIAEKKEKKPNLTVVRIVYLTTGIAGQVLFWSMVKAFSEWGGMD